MNTNNNTLDSSILKVREVYKRNKNNEYSNNSFSYYERLDRFLDLMDIQTGNDLEGNSLILPYDCYTYEFIEKLIYLSKSLKDKGYVVNNFFKFFIDIDDDMLNYQENYVYCGCCGNYAYHDNYGVNDQYYIDTDICEAVCKDCYDKDTYISYLINNKKNCNVLMSDEDIKSSNYVILSNYEFKNDMYGGLQCDKKELEATLKDIEFFYYLDVAHPYGTYYTICVSKESLRKTLKILKQSSFREFHI